MVKKRNSTEKLFKNLTSDILAPPPDLTISEWADNFRKLSSEASAEPGQWRTNRAPYQREIMDCILDPELKKVVVMSSAQVGKSEILLNTLGYHIDYEPCPILLVQPSEQRAKDFSKERIAPMIRDTSVLRRKVADSKSRDGGNTTLHKSFPGGYVALGGANAPSGLASKPVRILLADEIDRFPTSAGSEGDPLSLAEKRTNNFYNSKKVFVSTPTIKGISRIEAEFELSTQEHWNLPCPSCGEYQPLRWAQISFDPVGHRCKECGFLSSEYKWKDGKGKWIAEDPDASFRGFHLNEFVSPWSPWSKIISDFKEAKKKGPEKLKVWTNTALGETWEEDGEQLEEDELFARSEYYSADIPEGVKVLTAAVDVQDDRFEIEVVGWGAGRESWGIEYHKIYGDLKQQKVWNDLDEYLCRTWENDEGVRFSIACTCIDSGGHFTTEVYHFCSPRESRRVFAIKGEGGSGEHKPLLNGVTKRKREKVNLFKVGVDEGKAKVMSRLQIDEKGPGYCHFPKGNGYNLDYFKGLTAEKSVVRFTKGVAHQVWKKVRERNEPIDLRVYNTAALEILRPNLEESRTGQTKKVRKRKRKRGVVSRGVN